MKKKVMMLITLIAAICLLSGCQIKTNVRISYDKTGKGSVELFSGVDDELKNYLESNDNEINSPETDELKEYSIGGQKYYGQCITGSFENFDEFNEKMKKTQELGKTQKNLDASSFNEIDPDTMLALLFADFQVDKNGLSGTVSQELRQEIDATTSNIDALNEADEVDTNSSNTSSSTLDGLSQAMSQMYDFSLEVMTEAEIIETNGTLSADKHTATWNLDQLKDGIMLKTKSDFKGSSLHSNMQISYNKKGKGKIISQTAMNKDIASEIIYDEDRDEAFSEAMLNLGLKQEAESQLYKKEKTKAFENYDQLSNSMKGNLGLGLGNTSLDRMFEQFHADKNGITAQISEAARNNAKIQEMRDLGADINLTMMFTTEAEITEANGTLSEDKRSVTYDLTELPEEIIIKTKQDFPIMTVVILIIVTAAVAAGGIIVIKRLKQMQNDSDFESDTPTDET